MFWRWMGNSLKRVQLELQSTFSSLSPTTQVSLSPPPTKELYYCNPLEVNEQVCVEVNILREIGRDLCVCEGASMLQIVPYLHRGYWSMPVSSSVIGSATSSAEE